MKELRGRLLLFPACAAVLCTACEPSTGRYEGVCHFGGKEFCFSKGQLEVQVGV